MKVYIVLIKKPCQFGVDKSCYRIRLDSVHFDSKRAEERAKNIDAGVVEEFTVNEYAD